MRNGIEKRLAAREHLKGCFIPKQLLKTILTVKLKTLVMLRPVTLACRTFVKIQSPQLLFQSFLTKL
jgi:hypothetical protein